MSKEFSFKIRVYFEDTDAAGIVFYVNYLKFFERARTEWLRTTGLGHDVLVKSEQVSFVVKHTSVEYHAPARFDDELTVTVTLEKMGRTSLHFRQEAWRFAPRTELEPEPVLLASTSITVVCVDVNTLRPAMLPVVLIEKCKLSSGIGDSDL